jgi:hypothetical protein
LLRNTSSFANSFKRHKYIDDIPKEELGTIYIDIPGFYAAFFRNITDLKTRLRLFSRNTEKAVIHFIIRRVSRTDGPKTQNKKTSSAELYK